MIVYEWIANMFIFGISLMFIGIGAFVILILLVAFKDIVEHKWIMK